MYLQTFFFFKNGHVLHLKVGFILYSWAYSGPEKLTEGKQYMTCGSKLDTWREIWSLPTAAIDQCCVAVGQSWPIAAHPGRAQR